MWCRLPVADDQADDQRPDSVLDRGSLQALDGRETVRQRGFFSPCLSGCHQDGAGSEVRDSYIGPFTSVGENCRITDSELEFSIVLRDSSIDGVGRIENSLIGRHVEVTPAAGVSSAHRLVLDDHSKVQIHT